MVAVAPARFGTLLASLSITPRMLDGLTINRSEPIPFAPALPSLELESTNETNPLFDPGPGCSFGHLCIPLPGRPNLRAIKKHKIYHDRLMLSHRPADRGGTNLLGFFATMWIIEGLPCWRLTC